jgi:peptidyl-prolyl cis-trans isomerase B (cyclophilin B)
MKISQNRKPFKFGKLNLYLFLSFIIFVAATLPIKVYAGTDIIDSSSDISTDTTWTVSGSPYYVKNNVIVRYGATLTIEPGVRVKFMVGRELIMVVQGQLIARGTADSMIYFESGNTSSAELWSSIRFETGSVGAVYDDAGYYKRGSIFEYCIIKDSGRGTVDGAIECLKKAVPYINYCEIKNNKVRSVYFSPESEQYMKIENSKFSNNISGGPYLSGATTAILNNNTFSGNSNSGDSKDRKGGGAYIEATTATLTNNTFSGNSNSGSGNITSGIKYRKGGGAYIYAKTATLTNNIFSGNSCGVQNKSGLGVAVYIAANVTRVTNCTFKENEIARNNCVSIFMKYIGEKPSSQFVRCNFLDTKEYQIYNYNSFGTPDVYATENWWGTSVEAPITDKIYDFFYDSTKGFIHYRPYFKSPVKQKSTTGFSLLNKFTSNPRIKFETNYGSFTLELYSQKARKTVENFLQYVLDGFYNGTIFHKVIKGLMIQGGGLTADMREKTVREPIKSEADNGLKNLRGTVAMARLNSPHSATSQFFINVENNTLLDYTKKDAEGWGYCVFGKVVEGMSVVDDIVNLPTKTKDGYSDITSPLVVVKRATTVQSTTQVNTSINEVLGSKHDANSDKSNKQSPVYTTENSDESDNSNNVSPSVFGAKDSRVYHKRNCSEFNTDDLIEFASSQKAREAGGIPCKHCNPPSSAEENATGDKTGKSRTTYEWTGWKSLFENKN